jgi:Tat protein translocase TatB subunit
MLNVGGGELLVILLIALIVLGPTKLPEVARQVGSVAKELRRMSSNFQEEMKAALDEPTEAAARDRGNKVVSNEIAPAPGQIDRTGNKPSTAVPPADEKDDPSTDAPVVDPAAEEPEISTAEAAGMYDIGTSTKAEEPEINTTEAEQPTDEGDGPAPAGGTTESVSE